MINKGLKKDSTEFEMEMRANKKMKEIYLRVKKFALRFPIP